MKKVYVVDDSMMIWGRLVEVISDIKNLELAGVSGIPEEAYERIKTLRPELVVLDIKLYGGNGIKLLEAIKKEIPEIKIIMFTNYPYQQYRDRCRELGADYFFDKSKEFDKVFDVLTEAAGGIQ